MRQPVPLDRAGRQRDVSPTRRRTPWRTGPGANGGSAAAAGSSTSVAVSAVRRPCASPRGTAGEAGTGGGTPETITVVSGRHRRRRSAGGRVQVQQPHAGGPQPPSDRHRRHAAGDGEPEGGVVLDGGTHLPCVELVSVAPGRVTRRPGATGRARTARTSPAVRPRPGSPRPPAASRGVDVEGDAPGAQDPEPVGLAVLLEDPGAGGEGRSCAKSEQPRRGGRGPGRRGSRSLRPSRCRSRHRRPAPSAVPRSLVVQRVRLLGDVDADRAPHDAPAAADAAGAAELVVPGAEFVGGPLAVAAAWRTHGPVRRAGG